MIREHLRFTQCGRPRLAMLFLIVVGCQASARAAEQPQDNGPFKLWRDARPVPIAAELLSIRGVEFRVIKKRQPKLDGYNWLHGVALAWHDGKLYASYGHNTGAENTAGEVANGLISEDGGKTWGKNFTIGRGAKRNRAVSHGVFLSRSGKLWAFHGAFTGRLQNVHTRAFVLEDGAWQSKGVVARGGFWPMEPPELMDDGNWIMAGLAVTKGFGGKDDPAAVAISHGQDLTKWDVIRIPKPDDLDMWGECALIVNGKSLLCISRYRRPLALAATSRDYGRTWTSIRETNLPMAASQPFAGILSTGERFLIGAISADNGNRRSPLTIALSDPGGKRFKRIFRIRDAVHKGPGESGNGVRLSYPYAVEHKGKLYVAYSNDGGRGKNLNSAELAIIPIASLRVK